jgi:hypothetical protein
MQNYILNIRLLLCHFFLHRNITSARHGQAQLDRATRQNVQAKIVNPNYS